MFPPSVSDWKTVGCFVVGEGGDTSGAAEDSSEGSAPGVQAGGKVGCCELSWLASVGRGSVAGSVKGAGQYEGGSGCGSQGSRSKHLSLQAES